MVVLQWFEITPGGDSNLISRAVWAAIVIVVAFSAYVGASSHGFVGFVVGALAAGLSIVTLRYQIRWSGGWAGRTHITFWVLLSVGALVLALMGSLNTLLGTVRLDGVSPSSFRSLTTGGASSIAREILDLARVPRSGTESAENVVWWIVGLDSVAFIAAYLGAARWYIRSRLDRLDSNGVAADAEARRYLRWAIVAIFTVAVVDWVENLAVGGVFSGLWDAALVEADGLPADPSADEVRAAASAISIGWETKVLASIAGLAFWAKWLVTAVFAFAVVAERRSLRELTGARGAMGPTHIRSGEVGTRIRPLVGVLVALGVLLLVPIQISDVLLALADHPWAFVFTVAALAFLSLSCWVFALVLLRDPLPPGDAATDRSRELELARTLIVQGVLLAAVAAVLNTQLDWHGVAYVPGAMLVALGVANLVSAWGLPAADATGPGDDSDASMSQMVGEAADALASPIRGLPGRLGFGDVEDADRVGRFTSVQRLSAPVVLAAVPWWIVGGAMMRAGFGDAVYFTGRDTPEVTVALGAVLIAIGALVTWVTRGASRRLDLAALRHWRQGVLALAVATAAGGFLAVSRSPVGSGRLVGATALLLVWLAVLATALSLATDASDRSRAPIILRHVHITRWPILGALFVWLVVGVVIFPRANHDISPQIDRDHELAIADCVATASGDATPTGPSTDIDGAFTAWQATNELATSENRHHPLVIVSASGGGIRAAWWAAAVMGDLAPAAGEVCAAATLDGDRAADGRVIFAATGISGGSLGLATHQAALADGVAITGDTDYTWVEDRLGLDHLSPTLAWMAYIETAQAMLGFPMGRDRGEIMEDSWQEPWDEPGLQAGLRTTWFENPQLPLMVLSSASVGEGCRIFHSVLAERTGDDRGLDCTASDTTFTQAYGLDGVLCRSGAYDDMHLVSAALNSARFPLITPSGRMTPGDCATGMGADAIEAVDGGYLDSNGAEAAADVWDQLAPFVDDYNDGRTQGCVIPVFVQMIDDFKLETTGDTSIGLPTLLGPLEAAMSAFGARNNIGDERIDAAFPDLDLSAVEVDGVACGDAFAIQIQPSVLPGTNPTLGWVLSSETRNKMIAAAAEAEGTAAYHALLAAIMNGPAE